MKNIYKIGLKRINLNEFITMDYDVDSVIQIEKAATAKIIQSRELLNKFVNEKRVIYGVNTGVGGFVNYLIPIDKSSELQNNLINSVATNVGEYFNEIETRAIMLARVVSLSKGVSAIDIKNLDIYLQMINANILPCIPKKGSLGASGDLGPLAFIALVATGQWKAKFSGVIIDGKLAMEQAKIPLMKLDYKEGLAMINGTSAMTAIALLTLDKAKKVLKNYEMISALSFEGLATKLKPFDIRVHQQKLHKGQVKFAENICEILKSSKLIVNEEEEEKEIQALRKNEAHGLDRQIEDAYSIRCSPQILGPIYDTVEFVENILANELNSPSDNPLVIPEEQEVFHNGHFHGQYIAMAMDYLSVCLTTMSNLSDRRIDRFMDKNNSNGLPGFLCKDGQGLRLGLMGGQFMAASITAENRSLTIPLSIQTLTSTGDFQDIVSMGLIAARRCNEILDNACYIIAFELLCACQAIDIRGSDKISEKTKPMYKKVRDIIPFLNKDICITDYIEKIKLLVCQ